MMKRLLNNKKIQQSGWLFAGAIVGALVVTGAHSGSEKFGSVDLNQAIQQSEFGRQAISRVRESQKQRVELLRFVSTYSVIGEGPVKRLRALMLKSSLTGDEKGELEKIKNEAMEDSKKYTTLSQKKEATEDEKKQIQDYAQKSKANMQLLQEWQNEFSEEIYQLSQEAEKDGQKKAKEALEKTAKAKGFTGVFSSQVMPYSVNNLTEEVIKTMNGETKKESKKK